MVLYIYAHISIPIPLCSHLHSHSTCSSVFTSRIVPLYTPLTSHSYIICISLIPTSSFHSISICSPLHFHSLQFLTQEEFQKIRLKQLASTIAPRRGRKRQLQELLQEQEERRQEKGEILSEAAIQMVAHAKRKHSKEDRINAIKVRGVVWGRGQAGGRQMERRSGELILRAYLTC